MSKFYITTPIYYINDNPHIGHAYTTIAADAVARWYRQAGAEVLFSAGLDENSQKTVEAAEKAGEEPQVYSDRMAKTWQDTWDTSGISYDAFIRTTSEEHKKTVYAFMEKVQAAGDFTEGEYEGLYCVGCEEFKRENDLVDGKCPLHNRVPEKRKEKNYFFKLSKYQGALLKHIEENPDFIKPESRRNEVVAFIKRGLEDISVSRQHGKWGIDWPGDNTQKIYVWFDALVHYLTVVGYPDAKSERAHFWPPDVHLVGKDIVKFHAIYWPAMLMSAGVPLPKTIFAHGFFTIEGKKISKSLGNAVDPLTLAGDYGMDALRFYLLKEIPTGSDGEFTHERFRQLYESELANDLGNAVQRVASMITRYLGGTVGEVPKSSHDTALVREYMDNLRIDKALEELWVHVKGVNQFIEEEKPWQLAKSDPEQLVRVLQQAVADLTHIATMLQAFIPATSDRIQATFAGGKVNPEVGVLFPKFDDTTSGKSTAAAE
ncbi:methionine--tRNA ligase [Patescibacteria group bacterium]|nr:MAG: methionine--tRNA ligase [Patescibacteria group bacterium]